MHKNGGGGQATMMTQSDQNTNNNNIIADSRDYEAASINDELGNEMRITMNGKGIALTSSEKPNMKNG